MTEPWEFEAIGRIDGKFDCGYLVSVQLGSEILNGVLYHPEEHVPNSKSTIQSCSAIIHFNSTILPSSDQKNKRSRRRRRKRGDIDPSRPKPNRSGYNFFFAEKHSKLKSLYPEREREFTKMIGESWNNLGQEERMVYVYAYSTLPIHVLLACADSCSIHYFVLTEVGL